MTFSNINVSQPNDGLGDKLRNAFVIVNENFDSVGNFIETQVTLPQLNTILGSYSTITYVDDLEGTLQVQLDDFDGRLYNDELDIAALQTGLSNLTLSVDGKATISQLNNTYSQLNAVDADLQTQIDNKIDEAPADGKTYGRKDENWSEIPTGGGALPYKSYVALLSQIGTDDPTAVELYNDLGVNISYRYDDVGVYKIEADTSYFSKNKTICFYTAYDRKEDASYVIPVHFQWWNDALIKIFTEGQDDKLRNTSIEIRVY